METSPRPDRIRRWARSAVARRQSDSSGNVFLLESEPDWPQQVSRRNCRSCAVQSESERSLYPRLENEPDRRGKDRHLARSLPAANGGFLAGNDACVVVDVLPGCRCFSGAAPRHFLKHFDAAINALLVPGPHFVLKPVRNAPNIHGVT